MYCENCGKKINNSASKFCGECGNKINGEENIHEIKEVDITKTNKWSWGAFFLNWIYLIGMQEKWWIIVIAFICNSIPILNIVSIIYFGLEGRRIAWRQRKWRSFNQYLEAQKKWDIWGIVIFIIEIIIGVLSIYE